LINELPSTGQVVVEEPVTPEIFLDGSWERAHRSPQAAAILAMLGIGVLYFNGQSILISLTMVFSNVFGKLAHPPAGFFERLAYYAAAIKNPLRLSIVISQYTLILFPVLWLVRRWHASDYRGYIRLKSGSVLEVALAIAGTAFFFPVNLSVTSFLERAIHAPDILIKINQTLFTASSPGELFWLIFVIALTPAVCEEVLFRGYVQRTLERTIGWKSVLVAGVIFGLFHMQPLGLLSLSLMGILFGYFYYRTRSLGPSMAAHCTNNFLAVLILYVQSSGRDLHSGGHQDFPPFIVIISLVVEALILFVFHRVTGAVSRTPSVSTA
jgi:membrane protease YdiL (CAAX protease family)